ncbi:MAG: hypothetical protein PHH58_00935 [Rhodoferax sp.]|nr:hypothetical protein [Rhodoferax sp.]
MKSQQPTPSPLSAPIQALWRWLMARPGSAPCADRPCKRPGNWHGCAAPAERPASAEHPATTLSARSYTRANEIQTMRPLRVLQVVEAGQNPGYGTRLRISGRMADVCAELDRLAAREALLN